MAVKRSLQRMTEEHKEVIAKILTYAKRTGHKKTLCEWTNHLHRVFLLLIENFSAFAGRAAATEGSDLGGYPSTSVLAG